MSQSVNPAIHAPPPVYQILRYIEWTGLILVMLVLASGAAGYTSPQSLLVAFMSLAACAILSLTFPSARPLWQCRAYIALEVLALLPTRFATSWNLEVFLYIFLAKGCFLLPRRDVVVTVILTGFIWQIGFIVSFPWRLPQAIAFVQTHLADYLTNPQKILMAEVINDTASYLVASLFVILFSFVLIAEQQSRQQAIALTRQVESLAATLERTRIARDIHDFLGHTLTTLDIQLELAQELYHQDPNQALQALNIARELSTQSLVNIRQAVHTMRHSEFDLNQALMSLVHQFRQSQNLSIEHHINLPQLPLQTSYQLYCVIQEGLTNIRKHSQASVVSLHSSVTPDMIMLELTDDGIGFDLNTPPTGFGLRGIQERIQLLGGQFKIKTSLGQGTHLQVKIPR
jgi:signal transduction histidine kinase